MNETINELLVTGDKFVPKMRLRQFTAPALLGKSSKPGFTSNARGPFTQKR